MDPQCGLDFSLHVVAGFQVGCPKSKCLKRREAKISSLLKGYASNWHSIIPTLFYLSKQSQASLDSRGRRNGSISRWGNVSGKGKERLHGGHLGDKLAQIVMIFNSNDC